MDYILDKSETHDAHLEAIARAATTPLGESFADRMNLLGISFRGGYGSSGWGLFDVNTRASNDVRPLLEMSKAVQRYGDDGQRHSAAMFMAMMHGIEYGIAAHSKVPLITVGMGSPTRQLIDSAYQHLVPPDELRANGRVRISGRAKTGRVLDRIDSKEFDNKSLNLFFLFGMDVAAWSEFSGVSELGAQIGQPFLRAPSDPPVEGEYVGRFRELFERVSHHKSAGIGPDEYFYQGDTRVDDWTTDGKTARRRMAQVFGGPLGAMYIGIGSVRELQRLAATDQNTRIRMLRESLSFTGLITDLTGNEADRKLTGAVKNIGKVLEVVGKISLHYKQGQYERSALVRERHLRSMFGSYIRRMRRLAATHLRNEVTVNRYRSSLPSGTSISTVKQEYRSVLNGSYVWARNYFARQFDVDPGSIFLLDEL